ncbi:MAG: hypothetical protein V4487_03450, partial [Chlamydiota bacterium]
RESLKEKKIGDDQAVDLLARELVTCCGQMKQQIDASLLQIGGFFQLLEDGSLNFQPQCPSDFPLEQDGCNRIDLLFASFIQRIGKMGAKASIAIQESAKERYSQASNDRSAAWSLWIKFKPESILLSPHLSILTDVVWEDICSPLWGRQEKNVPAITQSVQRPVSRFLSSRAEIRTTNGKPTILYEGKAVAEIATIDPKLMPIVTKGSRSLNSIYHHKLLRFECKTGFENWAQGKADARVLRFERGETEIAETLGFKFKEAPSIIKSLLHAQAHMNFFFDDGSNGNLVVLRQFRSRTTNREEGVEIVLGTQLMPYYTFQTDRRNRLLVPVPDLPPLVSAFQFHAGQALLQMLIMEEFTNKSIDLATEGSIEINPERWQAFFKQSGLPESVFRQAIQRWLLDGPDGSRFLIQTAPDRYTLGESYRKEVNFLTTQGLHRKERQLKGKESSKKRAVKEKVS